MELAVQYVDKLMQRDRNESYLAARLDLDLLNGGVKMLRKCL